MKSLSEWIEYLYRWETASLLSPTTTLEIMTNVSPVHLHTVLHESTCIVAFGSDVPRLSPVLGGRKGRLLLLGPGSILDAHTDYERVKTKELVATVDAYERMALDLLAEDEDTVGVEDRRP